jgi:hypothetical protein
MSSLGEEWSTPDADGVRTRVLPTRAKSTLRGRRVRRAERVDTATCDAWPQDYRDLLRVWLTHGTARMRFATLVKLVGHARHEVARQLLAELLRTGWVEIEEHRVGGTWNAAWVQFVDADGLRPIAGLSDRTSSLRELERSKAHTLHAPTLAAIRSDIERLRVPLATRRMKLLIALDRWIGERRFGTRRDFALYVTGDTKGIPDSDWTWLKGELDLEDDHGIRRHIPHALMRAPWRLHGAGLIDLRAVPDSIGLSPRTLAAVERIEGDIKCWCIIENRTLFDRVTEVYGDRNAVLWVPGNPPLWWKQAIASLLTRCPAPARIACDPDPAGIQIAGAVGDLWQQAGQPWASWGMSAESLQSLPVHRALTDQDDVILEGLRTVELHADLARAVDWMRARRLKGEQEGLTLQMLELQWS